MYTWVRTNKMEVESGGNLNGLPSHPGKRYAPSALMSQKVEPSIGALVPPDPFSIGFGMRDCYSQHI